MKLARAETNRIATTQRNAAAAIRGFSYGNTKMMTSPATSTIAISIGFIDAGRRSRFPVSIDSSACAQTSIPGIRPSGV